MKTKDWKIKSEEFKIKEFHMMIFSNRRETLIVKFKDSIKSFSIFEGGKINQEDKFKHSRKKTRKHFIYWMKWKEQAKFCSIKIEIWLQEEPVSNSFKYSKTNYKPRKGNQWVLNNLHRKKWRNTKGLLNNKLSENKMQKKLNKNLDKETSKTKKNSEKFSDNYKFRNRKKKLCKSLLNEKPERSKQKIKN